MSERIGDIGIGSGGTYLHHDTNAIVIGIDKNLKRLQQLQDIYPTVHAIQADAKSLPLQSQSLSKIRCIFPFEDLLEKGLQPLPQEEGYFAEFARVLKPTGVIQIIGDQFMFPEVIRKRSARYFTFESIKWLYPYDLQQLGTDESDWHAGWITAPRQKHLQRRTDCQEVVLRKI